mgnify:FL=1|jgi:hypothetical protein
MKKLILILLLIPNLVMAETWVCSYLENEKIATPVFKRIGNQFIWELDSKLTKEVTIIKYDIWYESNSHIKLIKSNKYSIGLSTILLTKTTPPKFIEVTSFSDILDTAKGKCKVVK